MNKDEKRFKETLNTLEWPGIFPFKFIAPIEQLDELLSLFDKQETKTRFSRKANYVSVTATPFMLNPDKVIEKYKEAHNIQGVIAL